MSKFYLGTDSRQDGGHVITISDVRGAESSRKLSILHANHYCTGENGKGRQQPADQQSGAETPSQHFAQVTEVDRMPNARADACSDEILIAAIAEFRKSSELGPAEMSPRLNVKKNSNREE